MFSVMRRLVAIVMGLVTVLMASAAWAGPFDLNDASWEGCTDLLALARKELGKDRVVVL